MAKFKAGDAVKLRDDVSINANVPYNTRFVVHEIDELRRCYLDCGYWIFEDALEAWPESTEETRSNEIDPQLLELAKAIAPTICLIHMNEQKRYDATVTPNGIATDTVAIAKETLRLLRDEENTDQ